MEPTIKNHFSFDSMIFKKKCLCHNFDYLIQFEWGFYIFYWTFSIKIRQTSALLAKHVKSLNIVTTAYLAMHNYNILMLRFYKELTIIWSRQGNNNHDTGITEYNGLYASANSGVVVKATESIKPV